MQIDYLLKYIPVPAFVINKANTQILDVNTHLKKAFNFDQDLSIIEGLLSDSIALVKWEEGDFVSQLVVLGNEKRYANVAIQILEEDYFLVTLTDVKALDYMVDSEYYHSLFYDSPSIMFLLDPDTQLIVDVNKAACQFYGYTEKEFKNKDIFEVNINPSTTTVSTIDKVIKEGKSHFVCKHRLADGTIKNVDVYSITQVSH